VITRFVSIAAVLAALTLVLAGCSSNKKDNGSSQYNSTPGASAATSTPAASSTTATPSASNGGTPVGTFADNCTRDNKKQFTAAPPQIIDPSKSYTATITTAKGDIVVALDTRSVVTTNNFVFLACKGFYDGLIIHRVEDWVIQGGDPLGNGKGGPGYSIPGEFQGAVFDVAVVGMARAGDPNSAGSQFFITKTAANYLDGNYASFGKVTSGMDIVQQTEKGDKISSITIEEK
jgi:cyclophilin family peptidyl-prolyl cis-trans isomerase